jgi:hypothetical protein
MTVCQIERARTRSADARSSRERGQSAVIVTLLFVGVVAMLGFVLDGGNAYIQRRRMQNAADGASMAGAIKLANPGALTGRNLECAIRYEVEKFAVANGAGGPTPLPNCGTNNSNVVAQFIDQNGNSLGYIGDVGSVPSGSKGVSATIKSTFNTFFLGIVNQSTGAASAGAKASFGAIAGPSNLSPLTTRCTEPVLTNCFTYGQRYDIYEGGGPGNFGWLSWNGSNNAPYVEDMLDPFHQPPTINGYEDPHNICPDGKIMDKYNGNQCWVEGLPGVNNSSGNRDELNKWKTRGQSGIPMFIVINDQSEGSGSNVNYRIKGFAAFILEDYSLQHKWIRGKFIRYVTPGDFCTGSCFDGGLSGVHLRP